MVSTLLACPRPQPQPPPPPAGAELQASFAGNQAEVERSRQELQRQVMQLQATCAKLSDDAAATRELYALQLREAQQRLEQAEVGGGALALAAPVVCSGVQTQLWCAVVCRPSRQLPAWLVTPHAVLLT
jgi:hypothetical protein